MLKKAGAEYIIIGHSENRKDGETDKMIKRKIISSLKRGLNIIFCIGEKYSEKSKKQTFAVLRKQIKNYIHEQLEKSDFPTFLNGLLRYRLQLSAKKQLAKVYPLKEVAIRSVKLLTKEPKSGVEVREKKEKVPETPLAEEPAATAEA